MRRFESSRPSQHRSRAHRFDEAAMRRAGWQVASCAVYLSWWNNLTANERERTINDNVDAMLRCSGIAACTVKEFSMIVALDEIERKLPELIRAAREAEADELVFYLEMALNRARGKRGSDETGRAERTRFTPA